ncbi:unnamed protein product [Menidia menidia]|uniref:(Atlantic silverside) hypothetical protein n=1 Tax=Menidia menidia TaxID=238744 RepID=A0A8S4AV74_9TELE|nr:unnamed protein product [Menidia menidia]
MHISWRPLKGRGTEQGYEIPTFHCLVHEANLKTGSLLFELLSEKTCLSTCRMKLAVFCLCLLHLAWVGSGLFTRSSPPASSGRKLLSGASQSKGSINYIRVRPLFARRGDYERQRVREPRPKTVPGPLKDVPRVKTAPKPPRPRCSAPGQSCVSQSGCCDPCSTCHCRFFNAICFCRKTKPPCERKPQSTGQAKQSPKHALKVPAGR